MQAGLMCLPVYIVTSQLFMSRSTLHIQNTDGCVIVAPIKVYKSNDSLPNLSHTSSADQAGTTLMDSPVVHLQADEYTANSKQMHDES